MKKSILIMLLSCCMIIALSVPVLATSYTWTQGGNATKVKYDLKCVDESFVLNAVQEACGTTENVYYVCCLSEDFINNPEYYGSVYIYLMLDTEAAGIKGNVGYVKEDSNGLYTDSFNTIPHWKEIIISDNGRYIGRYNDCSSDSPWTRYVGMPQIVTITNIPVFYTKEGLDNYFATGNTSDMIGAEPEYDADMPYPTNLYMTYKVTETCVTDDLLMRDTDNLAHMRDFDFNLFFNLSEEAAECDVKIFYTADTRSYKWKHNLFSGLLFTSQIDKFDYVSSLISAPDHDFSAGEISINKLELVNSNLILEDLKSNSDYQSFNSNNTLITGYTFYLYCQKGNKKGNIVSVSVDMSNFRVGDEYQKTPVTAPVDVNLYDGSNSLEDIVSNNVNADDGYHFGDDTTGDYNNIISYITKGFGLVGNDGLIPMLGQIFSFMPKELITLLVATFGIVCTVIVIKFVRG